MALRETCLDCRQFSGRLKPHEVKLPALSRVVSPASPGLSSGGYHVWEPRTRETTCSGLETGGYRQEYGLFKIN